MEALLELDYPNLAIYSPTWYATVLTGLVTAPDVNAIAQGWLDELPENATSLVEVEDGAAGDTASVGVGFVNAALSATGGNKDAFALYARREVNWLLDVVPRLANGGISQRPVSEPPSAWDDFVYMVPPYLAYWGIINQNETIALAAYTQIKLYREFLQDPATKFWHHIEGGNVYGDYWGYYWGTGMAWAVAGITRVMATLSYSPYYGTFASEINDLAAWANEIISVTFAHVDAATGLLPNTYNAGIPTFDDAASSALMASAAYRLASMGVLRDESATLRTAEKIRKGVYATLDPNTAWLENVVDPLSWENQTSKSPESMAFVMLLEAAVRDYKVAC